MTCVSQISVTEPDHPVIEVMVPANPAVVVVEIPQPVSVVNVVAPIPASIIEMSVPAAVSTVEVQLPGTQGPRGPTGSSSGSGDLNFTFNQGSAASVWNITHNLGKFPSVSVVDTAGTALLGDISYHDANSLTLYFSAPFSGSAYLN